MPPVASLALLSVVVLSLCRFILAPRGKKKDNRVRVHHGKSRQAEDVEGGAASTVTTPDQLREACLQKGDSDNDGALEVLKKCTASLREFDQFTREGRDKSQSMNERYVQVYHEVQEMLETLANKIMISEDSSADQLKARAFLDDQLNGINGDSGQIAEEDRREGQTQARGEKHKSILTREAVVEEVEAPNNSPVEEPLESQDRSNIGRDENAALSEVASAEDRLDDDVGELESRGASSGTQEQAVSRSRVQLVSLSGFMFQPMNTQYVVAEDARRSVGGSATYWSTDGSYYLYYCESKGAWLAASVDSFRANKEEGACKGRAAAPSGRNILAAPDRGGWLESDSIRWVERPEAGVTSLTTTLA